MKTITISDEEYNSLRELVCQLLEKFERLNPGPGVAKSPKASEPRLSKAQMVEFYKEDITRRSKKSK